MDLAQVNQLTVYFVLTLLILVVILLSLFFIFNKRRLHYISEKQNAQERYKKELEASRIENQEHLFKALSWELHDNIGQLLSVSNLQLSMVSSGLDEKDKNLLQIPGKFFPKCSKMSETFLRRSTQSLLCF